MVYIPNDHWMICDRCGGKFRYSDMREHWDGLWLCKQYCWDVRHPQDFVRAVEDDQSVQVSRPDVTLSMGETTLAANVALGDITFDLTSATGLSDRDPISIQMDNSAYHNTIINGTPVGNTIIILNPMPYKAASGNTVTLPSLSNL